VKNFAEPDSSDESESVGEPDADAEARITSGRAHESLPPDAEAGAAGAHAELRLTAN